MPVPFLSYLRVYEPLRAFEEPFASTFRATRPIDRAAAGSREREMWLKSQLMARPRLLPGGPATTAPPDVLVLDPVDVIGESPVGPGPLVCPLEIRARSAAAVTAFLSEEQGPLATAAFGADRDSARGRAQIAMRDIAGRAAHVVSSTWTVPLPWFALVDPEAKQTVLAGPHDPRRLVCWRTPMGDARSRAEHARTVVVDSIGAEGPAQILADTLQWLGHFDDESAVELDYGGLVHLLGDEPLKTDTSAADVQAIVRAMEEGDSEEVSRRYESLREFWGAMAMNQRYG